MQAPPATSAPASVPSPEPPRRASAAPDPTPDPLAHALLHFGLGAREAQLYRALLKYGPMSARQSISLAGLDRATGYRVLSKLRARGLVTSTPTRPQRFVPLDVGRLFERTVSVMRDDLELLRLLREHYVTEANRLVREPRPSGGSITPPSPVTPKPRWPVVRIYPRADEIGHAIVTFADSAKEEIDALMMPTVIPEAIRNEVARAYARAVDRGVRVKIVVDYHALDLEFLSTLLKSWGAIPPNLEFRFFAPQLSRLFVIDHRFALRCIRSTGSAAAGPELGVSCDDAEFVRYQLTRFQSVWRESLPLQRTDAPYSPSRRSARNLDNPRDLRRWVERGAVITGRVAASELAALFGLTPPEQPTRRF
ncbi:MAG: hypothetical protein L3K17_03940 [Thermoplasmata archaeon]|nr:hypothetical protein [Thermoplasmata archaeon]